MLTDADFGKLVERFGAEKTESMIDNMDSYIEEDATIKKKYKTRNHYLTLLRWDRMDEERKGQQSPQTSRGMPQPKKTYTFSEVVAMRKKLAEEAERKVSGDVIDL